MTLSTTSGAVSADARMITMTVNGKVRKGLAEPRLLLTDFIRHELGLTGTNVGCEHGACGACTIRVNGQIVRSCIMLAVQADGAEVETVEGIAVNGEFSPLQEAFHEEHGLQCGFCTPGMLMTAQVLLDKNPDPTEAEIRDHMSGNICRCTGYQGIINSVRCAARKLQQNSAADPATNGSAR
ncbi:(2Fe-2S)-binding protein [Pseudonocardia sp. H11422]|uniref:(2Fe-2S)-binding protein n=1 Tax=Pseudonocardia sp. H11422 TaxID=2835866 RepID=UPI002028F093|nr:(2Fe-2S)-binding protein [Pseudonocardia sp. H11422]